MWGQRGRDPRFSSPRRGHDQFHISVPDGFVGHRKAFETAQALRGEPLGPGPDRRRSLDQRVSK
jgi:hypothetical protein